MASKKSSKSAIYYVQRLFEDEYVQGQLQDAASGIRSAYGRITKKPERAAEDKKLYDNVRQAAISIRKALVALRRHEPEPEPEPKRRLRTALTAIAVVGGSVLIISRRTSQRQPDDGSSAVAADASDSDRASERTAATETAPSPASE